MDRQRRAEKHLVDGQRKMTGWWFGLGADPELAAEHFMQASNLFKLEQQWNRAAEACALSAGALAQTESNYEAAGQAKEAGDLYQRGDQNTLAIEQWHRAAELFQGQGLFLRSARC